LSCTVRNQATYGFVTLFTSHDHDYGAVGAGVAARHLTTIDAVVVVSLRLNPGTGSCAYRHRNPSLSANRPVMAACAVISASDRYAVASLKLGKKV
jgi:hypothetical protein